jgi:hypothetical protein
MLGVEGAAPAQPPSQIDPIRRVIIEFRSNQSPVGASLDPFLLQLSEYLDFGAATTICDAPSASGETGRSRIASATLRSDHTFADLRDRLRRDERALGLYANPSVRFARTPAQRMSDDDYTAIARRLDTDKLHRHFGSGKGVLMAVVDTGVDTDYLASVVPVSFDTGRSWTVDSAFVPGHAGDGSHGTMVAFDALIAAPDVTFADVVIGQDGDAADASCAFSHLSKVLTGPGWHEAYSGLVVVNSWELRTPAEPITTTAPCRSGDSRRFDSTVQTNPCHPLQRSLAALAGAADVVFAAGGDDHTLEPGSGRCVPSAPPTIAGVNASSSVLTVAAVDLAAAHLPGSSVGPGAAGAPKPDVSAYAGFRGSGVIDYDDNGTSAAAAVTAGVVAAMRSGLSTSSPDELRNQLRSAALPLGTGVGDCRYGAGLLKVP